MVSNMNEELGMAISDVQRGEPQDGYTPVELRTTRGVVSLRHYAAKGALRCMIWVGGIGGDWKTPAKGLYPRLCSELVADQISSLHLKYRHPTDLSESTLDVLAGLTYLDAEGISAAGLAGHSFGGAVVIQAAVNSPKVRTVVTLSTQSHGAGVVSELAPGCSILLIHGKEDRILTPTNSQYIYTLAHQPKNLVLFDGAGHWLDEVAEQVHDTIRGWVLENLREE